MNVQQESCSPIVMSPVVVSPLPSVRPSLLDVRFLGDPCVVDHRDGTGSVRLADFALAQLSLLPFDLPSLNHLLLQLRLGQVRRRMTRPLAVGYLSSGTD